ncbi:MAG TPA: hypothetical protein DCY55_01215 [Gammaproteobacteria bacterium]|nr:hypothetical protein [Gammaproteobacteria bacterium]
MNTTVICGAGIAGVATAHYLKKLGSTDRIVLVDRAQPLSFTTAASGENFRDYWPQRCMQDFISNSLKLIRELDDDYETLFSFKQTGYEFVSQDEDREIFPSDDISNDEGARAIQRILSPCLHATRPYLGDNIKQVTQITQAGSFDVYSLGQYLYSQARAADVEFKQVTVGNIEMSPDGTYALSLHQGNEASILKANTLILAGGPLTPKLAACLGIKLPLLSYLQRKIVLNDPLSIIPRDMPFTIFADPQHLSWTDEEKVAFSEDAELQWLLNEFPIGLHIKPESDSQIKLGWAYNRKSEQTEFTAYDDESFPDVVMRGASRFIPGLAQYIENMPTPITQIAGYYTRTAENWPLIGLLQENCYTVSGLSGYGTMAGCAAGELCAQTILDEQLPWYARNFDPSRYQDATIMAEIAAISSDGQL